MEFPEGFACLSSMKPIFARRGPALFKSSGEQIWNEHKIIAWSF